MPSRGPVPCSHPGCPNLIPYGEKYCSLHKASHIHDRKTPAERGYGPLWRQARKRYLAAHPLCVRCQKEGRFVKATVVDHIVPHRGDPDLFWDENNWQALCKPCHDHKTMTEDRYQTY